MPRLPTVEQNGAIYHCVVRESNREPVFVTERDKQDFLRMLLEHRQTLSFELLAFALLDTQAHLIIKTGKDQLAEIMSAQLSAYALSFNKHHDRTGHVFQEKYDSYLCHSDERLLLVVRYVHQLPVRLGHSHHVNLSRWTSHLAYLGDKRFGLVDREQVIELLGEGTGNFVRDYQSLMGSFVTEEDLKRAYLPKEAPAVAAHTASTSHVPFTSKSLEEIAAFIQSHTGVRMEVIRSKSRNEQVVAARRLFIAAAVMLYSLPVSDVSKFLNVHHSYVSRLTFPKNEATLEMAQAAKELAAALGLS